MRSDLGGTRWRRAAVLAAVLVGACGSDSTDDLVWGYDRDNGPNVWRDLSPDFALCGNGLEQSPIDLVANDTEEFALPDFDWVTSRIEVGTELDDDNNINFAPVEENITELDDVEYMMGQFNFQTPAEHTIEGQSFDGELHFVHATSDGAQLVVGVMWEAGAFNNDVERLLQAIPSRDGNVNLIEDFDMESLLPDDAALYAYQGSRTTPPCTEGVTWLVYDQPLEASSEQLMELRDAIGGTNSRGIQPLNGRSVRLSN
ncbi:MAG: carbonic anhydrase family protein [Myxococcota bacterium]